MEQKIEKFKEILKSIGYKDTINYYSLKNAFESPELKEFFEWFVDNVNESWYIKPDKLDAFCQKQSKGHVIWDLNKLIEILKVNETNYGDDSTSELDLEEENEQMEKEIKFLTEQLNRQKCFKQALHKKLDHLKLEQQHTDLILTKMEKTSIKDEETLKEISLNIDNSLARLQENLTNDEQFQHKFTDKKALFDSNFENYISKEKEILTTLKNKIAAKYEYDYIGHEFKLVDDIQLKKDFKNEYNQFDFLFVNESQSSSNESTRDEFKKLESYLKLFNKYYMPIVNDWFTAKLTYEIEKANCDEMKRMYDEKEKYLEYTQQELNTDPVKFKNLEHKINQLKEKQMECIRQIEHLNPRIVAKLNMYSKLKIQHIIDNDMKKKQIELNLYMNKQDKILTCLDNQGKRIKSIAHSHKEKLSEIHQMKQLFTDLTKFFKSTRNNSNNNNINQSLLLQSNVSFSVSMANLLSSTSIPLSPSRLKHNQNSTMITRKLNHSLSYNGNLSSISNEVKESPFMHFINQLLITFLTCLKSDKYGQKYIKLIKPISVNFDDNLENFMHICETNEQNVTRTNHSNRKHLFRLIKLIENSMELMYVKQNGELDLSQIMIKSTRNLDDEYDKFERRLKSAETRFANEVLTRIKKHNEQLKSNEFEQLKRNFFTIFYNTPHLVGNVIEKLNSLD